MTESSPESMDIIIRGATVFDGRGSPGVPADVGVRAGRSFILKRGEGSAKEEVDGKGRWLMPGFIDFHTHYDAEIEIMPALHESVRHGVTTVFLGSCSLGAALGTPEDIADIFCRVEGIPRTLMLPMLEKSKDWETFPEYLDHLERLAIGPNVAVYAGHSNIRMHVMGFRRSVQKGLRPTPDEMAEMERLLEEALDAGYIGLSIQTLPWDKLDGDRERSQPLPSFFASWREYRRLTRILRRRGRIFQGVPNVTTKINVLLFIWESMGLFRRSLRTTVISMMDVIANRTIYRIVPLVSRMANVLLGANFRFQALPNLFDVWADGMDLVIFEEFGAGTEAMHIADLGQRSELLRDPDYRARFKKQWTNLFLPGVYHRDFRHSEVLGCPDPSVVGLSFAEIASRRDVHVIDAFLDLAAEHGRDLRWYTYVANDRPGPLKTIVSHPDILIGFSDAGAHLRNMAHYNFPLRLLRMVRDAEREGKPFMTIERAVHRLTGEIADWFNLEVGHLEDGSKADLVLIEPAGLTDDTEIAQEAPMDAFGGLVRLVRRNPKAVPMVMINGRIASRFGVASEDLGQSTTYGSVLKAVDR